MEPKVSPDRMVKADRSALEKNLPGYLINGGFPEAQNADARDRYDLLRGYIDTALFRDVVERHSVTHVAALRWMVRHLLGNAGGSFSVNKFYNDTRSQGLAVSKDTLYDYLSYLEDAFLIRMVSIASKSERRRMVNPRKIYPIDPGLIPIFGWTEKTDSGHTLETCIMLELERRGADIAYIRTQSGYEVDFLALFPDGREELLKEHENKYLLVFQEKLVGTFDTYEKAAEEGVRLFGMHANFLVHHLVEKEPLNFIVEAQT